MLLNRLPALLTLVLVVSCAPPPPPQDLVITGVNVVDVIGGQILPNTIVVINGDAIATVTQNSAPPAAKRVVDAQGKYLIPGLWDMHAHTGGGTTINEWHKAWLKLYVANGVTGIRDMGSDEVIFKMREATASGSIVGPRIFTAGPILDDAPGDWPLRLRVKTAEDGKAAVQMLKQRGVDLIKVHDHTPHDAFFAIAEEARRQNLPLAGHIPVGLTAQQVIDAGQGDIEHLSNLQLWKPCSGGETYRAESCRPFFEMLANRSIWQTPTIAAASELAIIGTSESRISADQLAYASKSLRQGWAMNQKLFATPQVVRELRAAAIVAAEVTRDMSNLGVKILTGCDITIAGFCVHDELAVMTAGGMTPLAALQTATINPARYFGREQTLGTVAPGRKADLVLLDGNPLADIANTRRIHAVVTAGRLLDRHELDAMLEQVKATAKDY